MSGRLVILPKKSYCPWNPDNVARVERDEARHREETERRSTADRQRQGQERIKRLRARSPSGPVCETHPDLVPQHVNLFRREEEDAEGRERYSQTERTHRRNRESHDARDAFYISQPVTSGSSLSDPKIYVEREKDRKSAMDPAQSFMPQPKAATVLVNRSTAQTINDAHLLSLPRKHHRQYESAASLSLASSSDSVSDCRSTRRRRRKRHRRRRRGDEASSSDGSPSKQSPPRRHRRIASSKKLHAQHRIDIAASDDGQEKERMLAELRRRRREREETERQRERTLLKSREAAQERGGSRFGRGYNDQFYPRIAR